MGRAVNPSGGRGPSARAAGWLAAGLLAGVLVVGLWRSGLLASGQDAAWERIQARGVLTVATDASYPPFSAVDANGALFGFDIDVAEALGRQWGVRVEFDNLTYDALPSALSARRDDVVISAFVPRPELAKEISFTPAYFVSGTVAVIRAADGQAVRGDPAAWASGKRLAVEYGAGGDALARRWVRQVAGITIVPRPSADEALQAVADGEADAALVDAVSAYAFLQGHAALVLAGAPLEPEPYVMAVDVHSSALLSELKKALAALEADGTLPALRVKWFGQAAR
jgi:ABC-type amino acid transport substrate-binding protein